MKKRTIKFNYCNLMVAIVKFNMVKFKWLMVFFDICKIKFIFLRYISNWKKPLCVSSQV